MIQGGNMKRVALYVRVSHEEQVKHGISVDAQISALEAYSKANNYEVVKIYSDEGISARKSYKKRPALLKLISDCQQGKIDLILICKLDRFFRSVSDYYAVMEQIGNVPWKAIQEDYETETSSGVFKVNIMLSVAQSEADRTSERIKAVFDYKRQKGEALTGTVSTGYMYCNGKWKKDPATQEGVQAFFDTYLLTFNKKLSISKARELGIHMTDETARNMLYGDKYHGVIPYIEDAYITPEQHELILSRKPQCSRNNKYKYIFTGLVRCGKCNHAMASSTSVKHYKKGSITRYAIYVCDYGRRNYDCSGAYISEKNLEALLLNTLESRLNDYNIKITLDTDNKNVETIRKCKERLKRIKLLFEMGDIDINEYKQKKESLLSEIESCKVSDKEPINLETNWKDIYSELDVDHKNSFWKSIIEYIEIPTRQAKDVIVHFK